MKLIFYSVENTRIYFHTFVGKNFVKAPYERNWLHEKFFQWEKNSTALSNNLSWEHWLVVVKHCKILWKISAANPFDSWNEEDAWQAQNVQFFSNLWFFWCEINFQEKQLLECHKVFLNSARKWHLTLRRGGQMTQNWCLFNSSIHYAWMTSNAEYEISKLLWNNFFHEDRISLSVANISKDWMVNISHLFRKLTIT